MQTSSKPGQTIHKWQQASSKPGKNLLVSTRVCSGWQRFLPLTFGFYNSLFRFTTVPSAYFWFIQGFDQVDKGSFRLLLVSTRVCSAWQRFVPPTIGLYKGLFRLTTVRSAYFWFLQQFVQFNKGSFRSRVCSGSQRFLPLTFGLSKGLIR